VLLSDGRRVQIVRQARFGHVGSEFLAVAPLPGAGDEAAPTETAPDAKALAATQLALPYELPT
jgi:hypothetical protein